MDATHLLQNTAYAIIVVALMVVAKKFIDALTSFDDHYQIEEESNLALAFRQGGFYLAMGIGLLSVLSGESTSFMADVKLLIIDGLILILMLIAAYKINDGILLRGIDNDLEIEAYNSCKNAKNYDPKGKVKQGNLAVGIAEFGSLVATGLIMSGAFSGQGSIMSGVIFGLLGQVSLIIMAAVYERSVRFDLMKEIKQGNASAGITLAGMLIALGFILRTSLAGNFTGWSADLASFGMSTIFGITLLVVAKLGVARLFLPKTSVTREITVDQNAAALVLTSAVIIGLSLIISGVV